MATTSALKPRKAPRQARSKATVDVLLDATARVLVSDGYAGASTNRIAEKAGVSIGSLYQYFPSKQALVTALRRRHAEQMLAMLAHMGAGAAEASAADAVKILVHAVIAAHRVDPQLHRVLGQEVPRPYATDGRTDIESDMRALTKTLLQAHRAHILPPDLDLASLMLFHTVESLVHAAVIDGRPAFTVDILEQEICTVVLRYLGLDQNKN
ncbi:TetR/AcrR family transcriptional regulator [Rhodoferax sp. UBA5149]|uniref:TetR/AcrR family transcriptional regulator n=1 Tax=Rhodoferax sp. UBA5149 TaxID=1947379 RepID=UPI0025DA0CC7|nr:TetR/AcrR family transcriptional regulator [Rhodoferax sp. UBA5149]